MKSFLQTFALTVTLVSTFAAVAQENTGERAVIETVQIMHRDPGKVRESIGFILDPRGSIGQIDDKLIIATTASNFVQIQERIAATDVPPLRLVIGVDFAYQPDFQQSGSQQPRSQQPRSQQQSQAIEGEALIFLMDDTDPDTDVGDRPSVTVSAEVMNDVATVNLSSDNVPGLAGSHIVRIPLGIWQRITVPVADADMETGSDTVTVAEAEPPAATVAVRVDRVP